MKIIRTPAHAVSTEDTIAPRGTWKLLVVDDEPDVRRLTAMNLRGFEFLGRPLQLLEAGSVTEAKALLEQHPDIAVALVDVVMETDDAGLRLVEHIRKDRGNAIMRLVIRTGQPGTAPELYVIDNYDIDDYRDKTELTAQKLYATVRLALKSYRDLQTIELNRAGLSRILAVPILVSRTETSLPFESRSTATANGMAISGSWVGRNSDGPVVSGGVVWDWLIWGTRKRALRQSTGSAYS